MRPDMIKSQEKILNSLNQYISRMMNPNKAETKAFVWKNGETRTT